MGQAIFTEVRQEVLSEPVMWEQRAVRGKSWNIQEKRAKAKTAHTDALRWRQASYSHESAMCSEQGQRGGS